MQVKKMSHLSKTAILLSMSLIISLVEGMFPLSAFIALPGVKLGLSNIATVCAFYLVSKKSAFSIAIVRPFVMLLFSGNVFSFAMSICGSAFAFLSLILSERVYGKYISFAGVSALSGVFHSLGQTFMCIVLLYDDAIVYYLPVFAFASCIMGALCGIIMNVVFARMRRVFSDGE